MYRVLHVLDRLALLRFPSFLGRLLPLYALGAVLVELLILFENLVFSVLGLAATSSTAI